MTDAVVDLTPKVEQFDPDFVRGNELTFSNGFLTDAELKVSAISKAEQLTSLGEKHEFDVSNIVYVGDSNTDIEAFEVAGKSTLFNPDPSLEERGYELADVVVDSPDISDILEYLPVNS